MGDKECKIEFSKLFATIVVIMLLSVAVFTCVMVWRTGDMTPLQWLIAAIGTALAVVTGFYYWKARAENKLKLKQQYKMELNDSDLE